MQNAKKALTQFTLVSWKGFLFWIECTFDDEIKIEISSQLKIIEK